MDDIADEAGPRRVINRASIAAAGALYQQSASFASGLIVARVIGAADYGIFTLARSLIEVAGIATRLGLDIGLQRFFGETHAACDGSSVVVVLRQVRLLAAAFALVPVVAIALGLGKVLETNVYHYPWFAHILLCLALALPFVTDLGVLGGAYRGILKLSPSVLAECVLLPTIRLAFIVILFVAGWRLWAVVAGTTLGSIVAAAFLALRARSDFRGGARSESKSWTAAFGVMRYSSILAVAVLVTTLTATIDTLMLGRFAPARELGQYSLVKALLVPMGVFGAAFSEGLGRLVAERHFQGDTRGMVHAMSLTARWGTLTTLPILAVFLFWGAQLTPLFGASFAVPQAVIVWLAAGQFAIAVLSRCGWALSMTGRHLLELKILSAGLLIAVLLCSIAVPAYGQLGAAVATCVSVAITNVARLLFVRRALGAFPFERDLLVIIVAGIALAWASSMASSVVIAGLHLSSFWNTSCGVACFLVAYGIAAWTGLLNEVERNGIRHALRNTRRAAFGP